MKMFTYSTLNPVEDISSSVSRPKAVIPSLPGRFASATRKILTGLLLLTATASTLSGQLYDNGPLINSYGTGAGGVDESFLQTNLGMNIYGFGHQVGYGYSIADDFTIPAGSNWTIDEVSLYAYQSYSPTTSTISEVFLRIWDGMPGGGGSIVFGDFSTNRLLSSTWSNTYRVLDTESGYNTNRPVMINQVSVGTTLPAGTYWLEWQVGGSPYYSGPWAPPITITGQTTTGNGLQSLDNGNTFNPVLDNGTYTPQGFPFTLFGTCGAEVSGNFHLTSQAQINNWNPCIETINGNLTISGMNINDLSPLTNLQTVTGNLAIQYTGLTNLSGLDNLATVGGTLTIYFNNQLQTLNGLNNVANVGSSFYMYYNFNLSDCCAAYNLVNGGVTGSTVVFFNKTGCNSVSEINLNCLPAPLIGSNESEQLSDITYVVPAESGFTMSPNPARSEVRITIAHTTPAATLRIIDLLGRVVFERVLEEGTDRLTIDLNNGQFENGLYLVSLFENGEMTTKQLVVQQ